VSPSQTTQPAKGVLQGHQWLFPGGQTSPTHPVWEDANQFIGFLGMYRLYIAIYRFIGLYKLWFIGLPDIPTYWHSSGTCLT
jgi:hypothetical protein